MRLMLVAAALAFATPAAADWQYTKWGTTIDQVQKASKGKLIACDASCAAQSTDRSRVHLRGEYRAGEFVFNTWMGFDSQGRLNQVHLTAVYPDQVFPIVGSMRSKYGEPESGRRGSILNTSTWRDRNDQVTLTLIGDTNASISYSPRITPSNAGL
jgi:hypothetical protein